MSHIVIFMIFHIVICMYYYRSASGLLRVCNTKQSPAEWLWQRVETSVHCHREKQQGFTALHSAVSHSVNEVGKLVFKR